MENLHRKNSWFTLNDSICLAAIVFVASGLIHLIVSKTGLFEFAANPYALLPALEVVVCLFLLRVLYACQGGFHARSWFGVAMAGFLFVGLGEMFVRLSVEPAQALFWSHLLNIGLVSIPIGFYMFAYLSTTTKYAHHDALAPAVIVAVTGFLLLLENNSDDLSVVDMGKGSWGYSQPLTTSFLILLLWVAFIVGLGMYRFVHFYRMTDDIDKKAQSKIIVVAATLSLIGAVGFDVLPRYMGYDILPIGVLFQTILPAGVIYAIYKYKTFDIDFSIVSDNIFNTLDEVIVITDRNYNIMMVNGHGIAMSGLTEQELKRSTVERFFQPAVAKNVRLNLDNQLKHKNSAVIPDTTIVGKQQISVKMTVSELDGPVPLLLFAFVDITEIKKYNALEQSRNKELRAANVNFKDQQRAMLNLLEDSQELSEQLQHEKASVEQKVDERTAEVRAERSRLEASINSLNIGFLMIDKNSQIITANAAYRAIVTNDPDQQSTGLKKLAETLASTFDILTVINSCYETGKNSTHDNVQLGEKMIRVFIAPIFEDNDRHASLGSVILVEDITEAKALERSRDEFFSIASHELRTPLTAIRGNTTMMMEFYKEQLSDPSLKEMVDDIHDSSIRLITIVNDFLDTSRLEQGKISFVLDDFDIYDLAKEVVSEFKAGEINPNLKIAVVKPASPLAYVHADRDRLKQTIINLVGNGCKFTDVGGVTIHLHSEIKTMHIDVTDTGKGIPVESINLLFRKFQQATNNILTRDSTRSTGLGLYISKLIIEGMQGKIYLGSSEVGKGSTFTIEIPIAKAKIIK